MLGAALMLISSRQQDRARSPPRRAPGQSQGSWHLVKAPGWLMRCRADEGPGAAFRGWGHLHPRVGLAKSQKAKLRGGARHACRVLRGGRRRRVRVRSQQHLALRQGRLKLTVTLGFGQLDLGPLQKGPFLPRMWPRRGVSRPQVGRGARTSPREKQKISRISPRRFACLCLP